MLRSAGLWVWGRRWGVFRPTPPPSCHGYRRDGSKGARGGVATPARMRMRRIISSYVLPTQDGCCACIETRIFSTAIMKREAGYTTGAPTDANVQSRGSCGDVCAPVFGMMSVTIYYLRVSAPSIRPSTSIIFVWSSCIDSMRRIFPLVIAVSMW